MKLNYKFLKVIAITFGIITFAWMLYDYLENKKDVNINYNKDYNVSHNHFGNNNKFSGVYYVKAPKNCGHIVLEHPANLVELSWAEKVPKGQHNEYTGSIWTYNPLPGKLLIFPSWLDHRVEPNLSKSPRVSFSFNIE